MAAWAPYCGSMPATVELGWHSTDHQLPAIAVTCPMPPLLCCPLLPRRHAEGHGLHREPGVQVLILESLHPRTPEPSALLSLLLSSSHAN